MLNYANSNKVTLSNEILRLSRILSRRWGLTLGLDGYFPSDVNSGNVTFEQLMSLTRPQLFACYKLCHWMLNSIR